MDILNLPEPFKSHNYRFFYLFIFILVRFTLIASIDVTSTPMCTISCIQAEILSFEVRYSYVSMKFAMGYLVDKVSHHFSSGFLFTKRLLPFKMSLTLLFHKVRHAALHALPLYGSKFRKKVNNKNHLITLEKIF